MTIIVAIAAGLGMACISMAVMAGGPGMTRGDMRLPDRATRWLNPHLERAGMSLRADAVLAIALGGGLAAGAGAMLTRGSAIVAMLAAVAPGGVMAARIAEGCRRREDRVVAGLPTALRTMSDALTAGRSLRDSLARAAREAPEPIAGELDAVVAELSLGGRLDDALGRLGERVPRAPIQVFVAAVLVCAASGANLARVLADLAEQLGQRGRVTQELRGLGAQARTTAWLVAGLPLLGGLMLEAVAPGVLARSLLHGLGLVSLAVAGTLMLIAVFLVRAIGRVTW